MKHWVGGAEGCSSFLTRQLCPGQVVVVKFTAVMLMVVSSRDGVGWISRPQQWTTVLDVLKGESPWAKVLLV